MKKSQILSVHAEKRQMEGEAYTCCTDYLILTFVPFQPERSTVTSYSRVKATVELVSFLVSVYNFNTGNGRLVW